MKRIATAAAIALLGAGLLAACGSSKADGGAKVPATFDKFLTLQRESCEVPKPGDDLEVLRDEFVVANGRPKNIPGVVGYVKFYGGGEKPIIKSGSATLVQEGPKGPHQHYMGYTDHVIIDVDLVHPGKRNQCKYLGSVVDDRS